MCPSICHGHHHRDASGACTEGLVLVLVLPLARLGRADLAVAGGKAANLGELLRVGLPDGFCVTTEACRRVVEAAGIALHLSDLLHSLNVEDVERLSGVGAAARELFYRAAIAEDVGAALLAAPTNRSRCARPPLPRTWVKLAALAQPGP